MTMPLLDKRLEVLGYALREAVEQMDFNLIYQLAEKALATRERIATEQLAASTPGLRERHDDIVIHDDAERGKVIVQFIEHVDERTRRVLKIYGFSGSGDVLEEAEVPTGREHGARPCARPRGAAAR